MECFKRLVVYYRDFPPSLESHINRDGLMSYLKDGSLMCDAIGKRVPRMTILMKASKNADSLNDKKRLVDLLQLLSDLQKTNQIIHFSAI